MHSGPSVEMATEQAEVVAVDGQRLDVVRNFPPTLARVPVGIVPGEQIVSPIV
jgi:hypothetical protein